MTFEGGKESKQGRKRVNANATKRVSYLASVKKINSCPIGKTSQAEHVPQKDILVALYCSMEAGPFVPQCVICAVLDLLSTSVWLHNPLSFRKIHFTIWERHILDGGPNDHLLLGTWTAKVSRQNPSQGALIWFMVQRDGTIQWLEPEHLVTTLHPPKVWESDG